MSRLILIYGQPGSGKTYSLKNMPPTETIIIDADNKNALPWKGYKKDYSADKKNLVAVDTLDGILRAIGKIATAEQYAHIKTLIIDGLGNAMTNEVLFYEDANKASNKFEKWEQVAKKTALIIKNAKKMRSDLNIVFTGHVETASDYIQGDVDKLFTPGQMLKKTFKPESHFLYVFYAKSDGEQYYFETTANNSTARSPAGCFDVAIPNDLHLAIQMIDKYEEGD